ncbi:MAG: Rha family transcriptional regulator [Lyngbya sp. HA4199-MV5]|jgi:hypothetical protein|nr:Rha family transcriptional regulator [Lyngbya sp. HA4199-MV5]
MSNLSVAEHDSILVVDSRLIAESLGVDHSNFLETIQKHQVQIEQAFGVVPFETEKPLEGSKGGRPERYALLNEDQSFFVMTLSRNTPQVVQCKLKLVKAFSEAKQKLNGKAPQLKPLPPSSPTLTPLQTDLALLRSLLQVKPAHPFVKWQGNLVTSVQGVADWLEVELHIVYGCQRRHTETLQTLGVETRKVPKTLRTKLGLSHQAHTLTVWTPRALAYLAASMTTKSDPAQKLTATVGLLPQLAALSLDDQISELYLRAVEAETVAVRSGKSALLLYLELGEKLLLKREVCKYGEWLPFLKQRGIQERKAQRAMQLWEGRDQLEGALKNLTLHQALNQLGKKTIAASESEALIAPAETETFLEPATTTVDVTPAVATPPSTPTPPLAALDPKLLVLDRIAQATRTATEIEALPEGSTLKNILTGQLSRAVQLMHLEDLTKDITSTRPIIEPDPLTVSDYAKLNGRLLSPFQIQQAGIQAARMYRNRHGSSPQQRGGIINGEVRPINLYPASDWDLVESAIALAVEA